MFAVASCSIAARVSPRARVPPGRSARGKALVPNVGRSGVNELTGESEWIEMSDASAAIADAQELYERGEYDEALRHHQRALRIVERVLGEEHPETAMTLSNIGVVHWNRGEYEEATDLLTKVMHDDRNDDRDSRPDPAHLTRCALT